MCVRRYFTEPALGRSGDPPICAPDFGKSGADRDRTDDLRLAKPALSQLSYSPDYWRPRFNEGLGAGARPNPILGWGAQNP